MPKKDKKNLLTVIAYSFFLVIVLFFLLVTVDLTIDLFDSNKHQKELYMAYNTTDKVSYAIKTIDNIDTDYIKDMNKNYISSLIDKIVFDINFEYDSSKQINLDYEYTAEAEISSEYKGNKVWKRKVNLVSPIADRLPSENYLSLNKKVEVNYKEYEELIKEIEKESNLKLDSYIDVKIKVIITSEELSSLDARDEINIKIPLGKELTNVTYTQSGQNSENIWRDVIVSEKSNIFVKIMYLLSVALDIIVAIVLLFKIAKLTSKDRFTYEINGAFKLYGDILVEVEEVPEHKKLGKIVITNFTDLVDVSDKINLPILYKKVGEDYHFFIMTDKYFYSYIIRRRFFNKKMSE